MFAAFYHGLVGGAWLVGFCFSLFLSALFSCAALGLVVLTSDYMTDRRYRRRKSAPVPALVQTRADTPHNE